MYISPAAYGIRPNSSMRFSTPASVQNAAMTRISVSQMQTPQDTVSFGYTVLSRTPARTIKNKPPNKRDFRKSVLVIGANSLPQDNVCITVLKANGAEKKVRVRVDAPANTPIYKVGGIVPDRSKYSPGITVGRYLSLNLGDTVQIGEDTTISVNSVNGNNVRLATDTKAETPIKRLELLETIV